MDRSREPSSNVRLFLSGAIQLILLAWIFFVPDTLPGFIRVSAEHPGRMIVSAGLCIFALAVLPAVFARGSGLERAMAWLSLGLPLLILCYILGRLADF